MDLQTLPNELLFNISCRLSSKSLCNLSLVSKHLAAISQIELHVPPKIKCENHSLWRIISLRCTLSERPDIAATVQSLEVEVAVESGSNIDKAIRETRLVGNILWYVVNLQRLKIAIIRHIDASKAEAFDPQAYARDGVAHLFNLPCKAYKSSLYRDLSQIPGLKKLTSLSMTSRSIEWAWCALPRLKKIHIGQHCEAIAYNPKFGPSQIQELSLDRGSEYLFTPPPHQTPPICRFLARVASPKLVKLVLTLCNTHYSKSRGLFYSLVTTRDRGSFENLIRIIAPVASTLEHLVIKECSHKCSSVLDFVHPVTSMTHFQRLRKLEVPHEVIFGRQYRPAATILPAKLEHLHAFEPQNTIYPVLEWLATHPEDLPSLRMIEMTLHNSRGLGFEEIKYRHREFWGQLTDRGVRYQFYTLCREHLKEWSDETYDPFICEIVEYLESLKSSDVLSWV